MELRSVAAVGLRVLMTLVLGSGCDGAPEPSGRGSTTVELVKRSRDGAPPERVEAIACEQVTEENAPKGRVRVRFGRLSAGMSPVVCGDVIGPNDALAFARYLQHRLEREAGCERCQINRVDLITLLDVDVVLEVSWRTEPGTGHRELHTFMPSAFAPELSPEMQLEDAHFFFMRGEEAYEAYYEGLCPGSNPDPDTPGRRVEEACMRFHETPTPWARRPGLWDENP